MAAPTLSPPPLTTALGQVDGMPSQTWARWLQQLQSVVTGAASTLAGALHPKTPALASQSGAVYQGGGVPSNANGNNGDVYFRTDTPGTANQRLYVKASGSWVGIL